MGQGMAGLAVPCAIGRGGAVGHDDLIVTDIHHIKGVGDGLDDRLQVGEGDLVFLFGNLEFIEGGPQIAFGSPLFGDPAGEFCGALGHQEFQVLPDMAILQFQGPQMESDLHLDQDLLGCEWFDDVAAGPLVKGGDRGCPVTQGGHHDEGGGLWLPSALVEDVETGEPGHVDVAQHYCERLPGKECEGVCAGCRLLAGIAGPGENLLEQGADVFFIIDNQD